MSFNCLNNYNNDSIFIENEKQLKKYQKKIRLSKNLHKILEFQDAIEEYHFRHRKLIIKKKDKTIKNKINSDNDLIDKAIQENNGYFAIIISDKTIKEQRRIEHRKNVNKKKIESNINGHIKHCMRKYIIIWRNMNKYMKCGYFKGKLLSNFKKNIFINWHMIASKIQCSICYNNYCKDNIQKTDCEHEFCSDCINKWSKKCFKEYNDATCPLCRQVYEYRPINYSEPSEQFQETLINNEEYIINYNRNPSSFQSPLNVRRRLFENHNLYENVFMTREHLDSLIPEPINIGDID